LCGREQSGIECRRIFIVGDYLGSLFNHSEDGRTSFSLRFLVEKRKYLFQPFYLSLGFGVVLFKGRG
jgi:hypothetical protein